MHDDKRLRLQVYLARSGVASRRASEEIIAAGRVTVNGVVQTTAGTKVVPADTVCVDGLPVSFETTMRYVLLNKPVGLVCSAQDEQGRAVAADVLKTAYSERLYSVGRLDMYSSGAIIFTNDGTFAAHVGHPSANIEKEYELETTQDIPEDLPKQFLHGLRIDTILYRCAAAKLITKRRMRVTLIEGKNREIRRVFAAYKIPIKQLTRIRIGTIQLGSLREGEFRPLTEQEKSGLLSYTNQR